MSPLLELRNVGMSFPLKSPFLRRTVGAVRAVDDVTLSVGKGETLGLVGESGSGKSTVGRIALGLLQPTEGEVLVEGTEMTKLKRRDRLAMRRKLQFVFQDPYSSLDPFTPVGDSIGEPLRTHNEGNRSEREARVSELLELVGLRGSDGERYPSEFSGGQLQRIAIARALALDPSMLLLDEPVSSLDVSTQAEVVNLLGKLQDEVGVAYVFIAHDLAVVDHVSSRIAVLYLGQVVEHGTSDAIVNRPKHPYTLSMLSAVPGMKDTGAEPRERIILEGELPSPTVKIPGCKFHTRCPFAMDVCKEVVPPTITASDGATVACHLHTEGPTLAGESVTALPLPVRAESPA